tara:strand:- start:2453 stop:2725 length:273 start_codon:yes stop_codon:yes gene_type:complete
MKLRILQSLFLFFGCATNASVIAAERESISLEPSSNWIVDYADDSCRLIRQFGVNEDTVVVFFNRFAPGDEFHLTVAGEPVALTRATNLL